MLNTFTLKQFLFLFILIILLFEFIPKNCLAVEPEEFLKDSKLEIRARNISKNIRCLVCQNQSIDDSSAQLAKDLRIIIRKKIIDGRTDKEIYKFLTDRYGNFILLKPPLKNSTYVLWFLPFVFFIIGVLILFLHNKKSNKKFNGE
tara:strand:+ start:865 stop:1302 length:438 start_codon:yes stop_codon:yes gene_type:complete